MEQVPNQETRCPPIFLPRTRPSADESAEISTAGPLPILLGPCRVAGGPPHPASAQQFYNRNMARGWESKSVEAQQAEATETSSKPRVKLTPEAAARRREQENLRLSRQSIVQQ